MISGKKCSLTAALVVLSACVPVSSAGVYSTPIDVTITSAKPPKDFALCASQTLTGNNSITNDGDHYWVTRFAHEGTPFARWDFSPTPGGSIAELRSTLLMGSAGDEKVRRCA